MTTVGIIGCGFVGGALKDWLEKNNKYANAFAKMTDGTPFGKVLAPLHELNVGFLGCKEHV